MENILPDKTTHSQTHPSTSPWMDTEQAAKYIGCRPGTLKTWRAKERGPRYFIVSQKLIRYSKNFLDEFIRGENLESPRHIASLR